MHQEMEEENCLGSGQRMNDYKSSLDVALNFATVIKGSVIAIEYLYLNNYLDFTLALAGNYSFNERISSFTTLNFVSHFVFRSSKLTRGRSSSLTD